MSDYVRYKGKLILEPKLENETLEEQCKRICIKNELEKQSYQDTYEEVVGDDLYDEYIVLGEKLYKLKSERKDCAEEFTELKINEDETISFHTMFYNGGCNLHEALDSAYDNIKK